MNGSGGNVSGDGSGGWSSGSSSSLPQTLSVDSRSGNEPLEYTASYSIEFTPGFNSGDNDAFTAFIITDNSSGGSGGSGGSGSVTIADNGGYRYGFNGKEIDGEVSGHGNQYDYGFRIYNPRLGRFLTVDPLSKSYPWNSSYAFAENEPISNIDLDGLEKYKVTVRTFLPYTYVWEPQSSEIIDKANTRWYPQYKNVEAHGGFKSEQQFNVDFDAGTTTYLSPSVPATFSKNLKTGEIKYFPNAGLGDDATATKMFEDRANINAEVSTKNPVVPKWMTWATPAIDYQLNISVMKDGTWLLNGKWDGFPALEVFIEDLETSQVDLMHFDNTSDAGKDLKDGNNPKEILNLYPANPFANNGDVKINKAGQIGGHPQQDRATPSPKVDENKKRFTTGQDCKCDPEPDGS